MLKSLILFAAGTAIAVAAGLASLGAIAKNKAPHIAVSLLPLNGFAAENLASLMVRAAVSNNAGQFPLHINPQASEWARLAFVTEPTTSSAVAVLALNAPEKTKSLLMEKAFALSRREQIVTGWMIADNSKRGDTRAILNYYDTALRTNSSAAPVLIPVMVQALSKRDSIDPFTDLLSGEPPWAGEFWEWLAAAPASRLNGAILREKLFRKNENKTLYRDSDLILSLAYSQNFAAAENLYSLLADKSPNKSLIKNSSFDHESYYPPLDWELMSTGEYGAAITGGKLRLSSISDSGGLFAKQLVRLPSAIMEIQVKVSEPIPDEVQLVIGITCAEKLTKMPDPIRLAIKKQTTVRKIGNRQSGCQYFWVDVSGRAAENGAGLDLAIESLSLHLL